MVRRVGFGDGDRSQKHRKREEIAAPPKTGGAQRRTRLIVGGFLLFWLIGWSAAIAASVSEIVEAGLGGAETFLIVWTAVAGVFWVLAAVMLWRVLTGRPLSNTRRRNWGRAPLDHGGVRRGDWDHGSDD